ncbi:conjugal transfer protein TraG, partial [Flavobacterium sp. HMWF030]
VADDPDCKIELKTFHSEIVNDHKALKKEQDQYVDIPIIRKVDNAMVQRNYLQIKKDIKDIIYAEKERLLNDIELSHLVIKK